MALRVFEVNAVALFVGRHGGVFGVFAENAVAGAHAAGVEGGEEERADHAADYTECMRRGRLVLPGVPYPLRGHFILPAPSLGAFVCFQSVPGKLTTRSPGSPAKSAMLSVSSA